MAAELLRANVQKPVAGFDEMPRAAFDNLINAPAADIKQHGDVFRRNHRRTAFWADNRLNGCFERLVDETPFRFNNKFGCSFDFHQISSKITDASAGIFSVSSCRSPLRS